MRGLALLLLQLVAVATSTQALPARARTRSGPPLVAVAPAVAPPRSELLRWRREASRVTIVRDDWGIAHVQGHSDADAVFGMEYAQAEDDFDRVETNYLAALGRLSEAEGPSAIARDLRARLDVDDDSLRALYRSSPAWLRSLMDSFADGLNFYLATHPAVTPRAIRHFEPWMALSFTEGSIGGDVERIDLDSLAAFYGAGDPGAVPHARGDGDDVLREPEGSNGIAIAPALTRDGHALLWINPHTSFYFRSELQVSSDEGLDAYGAVTWGQFFVYQGFNRTAGWMHTSSGVDAVDEFLETVSPRGRGYVSRHGDREEPVASRRISIRCLTPEGLAPRRFTAYFTRHGPVVRRQGARWVSVRLMHDPVHALMQSFLRTKAANLAGFRRSLELHANSSNNTVFADAQGHIAYFHANWIPRRDTSFDWTQPVDGSDPRTDGRGVLAVDESPNVVDPASGWLYNSNNWPWSAAGPSSPRRADFPRYVETGVEETPRGEHALHLLAGARDWTMDGLTAAAFDSELPAFQHMVPALVAAWEALPATDARRAALAGPVDTLRAWNERWGEGSVATSLAVFWGECAARRAAREARAEHLLATTYVARRADPDELLGALAAAIDSLSARYGSWRMPWGEINRFQRPRDERAPRFDDALPSVAVPFTSSLWGSLASFGLAPSTGTRKRYGASGNSFVAVVEFGDSVRAKAVTAGGESGDPASPHFDDEAGRYASGQLRDVYFEPGQLAGHTERTYHPGQ